MPIWVSGVICFLAISQQWSFVVLQSLKMDRHLGPNFQIPAASMASVGIFVLIMFILIYDRFLVPAIRHITKIDGGITLLQRQGVEMVIALIIFIPMYDRFLVPAMRCITKIDGGITLLQRQGVEMVITILFMFLAAMVDDGRTQDLRREIVLFQMMAISLNGKFGAAFTHDGRLLVLLTDFLTVVLSTFMSEIFSGSTCKQGSIEAVIIATGVHTFVGKATHLVDSTNQVGHFQKVLTVIGNFCICSIAVGMIIEIIVIYPIQKWSY